MTAAAPGADGPAPDPAPSPHADEPRAAWADAHARAEAAGLDGYLDPGTGLFVLTAGYLRRRGTCCGSGCRHCPW